MNILKSLIKISFITVCVRILGFIRDTIMARIFGVGAVTDAFFIAFKSLSLLRRIFGESTFHQVFLPVLSEYKSYASEKSVRTFIARTFGFLIVILIVVVFIGIIMAPWIIMGIAPGLNSTSEKFIITVTVFKIIFPYILLISLVSLMGIILNVWNVFLAPAFIPIFLNISMIFFMLFLDRFVYFYTPIVGLAWSVIFGGLLQFIYCAFFLKKINMLVFPKIYFGDERIKKIFQLMSPTLIIVLGNQFSLFMNIIFASFLKDGSISWIYYSDRLMELPVGMFGVALTTILLPYLSRFIYTGNENSYFYLMNWGIKLCYLLSFPSVVFLGVFSKPLVITLFQYGKFSEFDVLMTQYSVIAYSVGLPGLILAKVLTSGFYARCDIIVPVRIILITIIVTQLINLICINFLQHVVFALSLSMGAWLNSGLLYWKFKKKYLFKLQHNWIVFFSQLIIATFIMCVVCFLVLISVSDWTYGNVLYRLFRMIGVLILCGGSYIVVLWCLGMRLKDFMIFYRHI